MPEKRDDSSSSTPGGMIRCLVSAYLCCGCVSCALRERRKGGGGLQGRNEDRKEQRNGQNKVAAWEVDSGDVRHGGTLREGRAGRLTSGGWRCATIRTTNGVSVSSAVCEARLCQHCTQHSTTIAGVSVSSGPHRSHCHTSMRAERVASSGTVCSRLPMYCYAIGPRVWRTCTCVMCAAEAVAACGTR